MKQLSELSNAMLVEDHHHLKTNVWPEYLGLSKFGEVKRHLDGVLNCRTQFEHHQSNLYSAPRDWPKDLEYIREYLDHPESIS